MVDTSDEWLADGSNMEFVHPGEDLIDAGRDLTEGYRTRRPPCTPSRAPCRSPPR
jgi:hypothetical protein